MIYTWHAPAVNGMPVPAENAKKTAEFAVRELAATTGRIVANARDVPALAATLLAERVIVGGPAVGIPQAGTLYVES